MGKNSKPFFIRQNIRLSSKIMPSNDNSKFRLTFLEAPYRIFHKTPSTIKTAMFSIFMACTIPYMIYQTICALERSENRAKLKATLGEDAKMLEYLENHKVA